MTTPSHEHDDDLEPTVTEDELEVERYDVEDGTPSGDAKDSWSRRVPSRPRRTKTLTRTRRTIASD